MAQDDSRKVVVDTSQGVAANLTPLPLTAVTLRDAFWAPRLAVNREVTIPSQLRLLEETGRLANFRRVTGKAGADFRGLYFNDSDVYKWVEAASWALAVEPDEEIAAMVDAVIADVAAAQRDDGYLNTYYSLERADQRWTNLRDKHELYCAGHLFQAAVAHHRATGSTALLDIAVRFADHICATFGAVADGKKMGTGGHPEIEMGMAELARDTGDDRYMQQAAYFLDVRGTRHADETCGAIGGRDYHQDHLPFREFDRMIGHAVRAVYLNAGATDIYTAGGDETLMVALDRMWRSMTERQMYITGGIGSRHEGEAFGADYELPNAQAYTETCASIAAIMWAWRMLAVTGDARYADVMELELYNGFLAGLGLDGASYFYVNPLADDGKHRRQPWYECACCPPNIARMIASLPGYFYNADREGNVWVHLYAEGEATIALPGGGQLDLAQRTHYPWDGDVEIEVTAADGETAALYVRIPGWAQGATAELNGGPVDTEVTPGTYARIAPDVNRGWHKGDAIRLHLPMMPVWSESHPYVLENAGSIALSRGPLVYCFEGVDHPGVDLRDLRVSPAAEIEIVERPDLLGGVVALFAPAQVISKDAGWDDTLYRPATDIAKSSVTETTVTGIPYYAWANREAGPMQMWLRHD